jgi:peroxiredoxin
MMRQPSEVNGFRPKTTRIGSLLRLINESCATAHFFLKWNSVTWKRPVAAPSHAKPKKDCWKMRLLKTCLLVGLTAASPAFATLQPGAAAPDFSTAATLGGNEFAFHLAEALKKGPVVLYFYPAAFTPGCTIEAHEFAEAVPHFAALHATVIGVSMDGIAKLKKFSVQECRSKFPVASDANGKISHDYDAVLSSTLGYASRTSYVIAPNGQVIYAYNAMSPEGHVGNTLKAVTDWEAAHH